MPEFKQNDKVYKIKDGNVLEIIFITALDRWTFVGSVNGVESQYSLIQIFNSRSQALRFIEDELAYTVLDIEKKLKRIRNEISELESK